MTIVPTLLHHLIVQQAERSPYAIALQYAEQTLTYAALAEAVQTTAHSYLTLGLQRHDRVAVYLEKRLETVIALFAAAAAGGVFVPINPLLKAEQVNHILTDCNVRILITSPERLELLAPILNHCPDLQHIVLVGALNAAVTIPPQNTLYYWDALPINTALTAWRIIDNDIAAILYTSGSTGQPKGVVLSHRNFVAGAISVASYLENSAADRILAVLPLSFDYGFNQLTTAFLVGARIVLMNYLLPRDVMRAVAREKITGLAAVPPLWIQLAQLDWPIEISQHLRYFTNSGGAMPTATLNRLQKQLPQTQIYLMYGLTEAFRSTYLPPDQIAQRPNSIGKPIPNAEVVVVRPDGNVCAPNEPGELIHRGVHVALGYWNDPVKTAERFRPVPQSIAALPLTELAVWSGDTVTMDADGFLYFIGRQDDMIKTSGYRVSPTEIEEVCYATGKIIEIAAIGITHAILGQAIVVVTYAPDNNDNFSALLLAACQLRLPAFMVPARIIARCEPLPRNPNGKIDRKQLAAEIVPLFTDSL